MPEPIEPTRIIPAGWPVPRPPAAQPRPPVVPPSPPPPPWWRTPAPPPPGQPPVHITVDVHLAPVSPEPEPGWWERRRPVYQAACIVAGLPVTGVWAAALDACHRESGLAGAWVLALGPLLVSAFADNVFRAAAAGADPDLWPPRIRAAAARIALWAAVLATTLALPVSTVVYLLTGVPA